MGTKFKSNVGTQPNAAGLPQIPAGATKIPQSFLNGIGRKIDQATVRHTGDTLYQQLAGGTLLQMLDMAGNLPGGYAHPFKVTYQGKPTIGSKVLITISEGHIIGRMSGAAKLTDLATELYDQAGIGVPGVDFDWAGGWPNGQVAPDESAGDNPKSEQTQKPTADSTSGGTYHTPRASGNAGSITNPNQGNSGIYHNNFSAQGNNGKANGNAGSVTGLGFGGGTYHTVRPSGNAGSVTGLGFGGGTYHTPPKQ